MYDIQHIHKTLRTSACTDPGSRHWRLASGASSSAANIISGPLSESDGGATTFCSSALYRRDIRFPPINRGRAGVAPENFRLKNIAYGGPHSNSYGGATTFCSSARHPFSANKSAGRWSAAREFPLEKCSLRRPLLEFYGGPRSKSNGGATTFCSSELYRRDIHFSPIYRRRAGVPPENF